jgi:hypothetical protein
MLSWRMTDLFTTDAAMSTLSVQFSDLFKGKIYTGAATLWASSEPQYVIQLVWGFHLHIKSPRASTGFVLNVRFLLRRQQCRALVKNYMYLPHYFLKDLVFNFCAQIIYPRFHSAAYSKNWSAKSANFSTNRDSTLEVLSPFVHFHAKNKCTHHLCTFVLKVALFALQ